MSERPIEVGDLVMIVKPNYCCGSLHSMGYIFTVEIIEMARESCSACGQSEKSLIAYKVHGRWSAELSRLKRIPPLSDLESTDETIKETV